MSQIAEIAVPCRVVTLKVMLGAESGATTLEDLVARAVVAGRRSVEEQAGLFSLPHRVMLDVVHGLWSKGYVSVDFSEGTLEVTDMAKELIASGASLQDASSRLEDRKFLFEPVTGIMFPHDLGLPWAPRGSLQMPVSQGISASDLPSAELLRVVRTAVRHDQRTKGFRQNVLDVSFGNPMLSDDGSTRWLSVQATVFRDPDTRRLSVQLADTPGWNQQARARFQAQIAELAERRPDSSFITELDGRAALRPPPPENLSRLVTRMTELVEQLAGTEFPQMGLKQQELVTVAQKIGERVDDAERFRAVAEVVAAGAGVRWVLDDLIRSAEHQLVMSVPTIEYGCLNDILPDLEDAAGRGVTLVFLWGPSMAADLADKVKTALFDLRARYPEQVLIADRSARTTASVVIQDDQRAYVGSQGVLTLGAGTGVLVRSATDGSEPPLCVVDLLIWARRSYPYWRIGQRIAFRAEEFRRTGQPAAGDAGWFATERLPGLPDGWEADEVAARAVWADAWRREGRRFAAAVAEVHRGHPIVRMTSDAAYRDLVQYALHSAADRLAVTDDHAENEICGDSLARVLRARMDAGVVVHLHHPVLSRAAGLSQAYADVTRDLGHLHTLRQSKARARAVVHDHEVLTGSYSPLGDRTARSSMGARSGHVGLHITGSAFTEAFTRELGIADWYGSAQEPPPAGAGSGQAAADPLSVLAGPPDREVPWMILEDRRAAGVPDHVLRAEAATTLRDHTSPGPDRDSWANWLLEDAWRRHAFVEACLLSQYLGEDTVVPPALGVVAVPVEHGPVGELLFFAAMELQDRNAHRTVALIGAIAELLLWGGPGGAETYDMLIQGGAGTDRLPSAWLALGERARECHVDGVKPLPLEELARRADLDLKANRAAAGWSDLARRIGDLKEARQAFAFTSGRYLHDSLVAADGLLSRILAAASPGTTAGARQALAESLPKDVRKELNRIVADGGYDAINWSNHLAFAEKIKHCLRDARELARLSAAVEAGMAGNPVGFVHAELARTVASSWDELFRETEALGPLLQLPGMALLKQLRPLDRS
ncbi:hypothetical protein [Streptomyces sp. NBC_00690]|uniref:hypothetical protein n=1 Tax=Streptomyces sp. NBC_00690 TaxID=2975808 RepID=UPI002E2AFD33|nr:hypothetical protein [Streptomyces sp. NBC_00690]